VTRVATAAAPERPGFDAALEPPRVRPGRGGLLRAPWYLWVAAAAVLLPIALPFVNLLGRVLTGGSASLDTLATTRTVGLLVNTSLLTVAVTSTASALGIGAAWVVVRTDVALAGVWTVLVSLPLVIPSYVIALTLASSTGPNGLIADLTGIAMPAVTGFWGSWAALTFSTYPFVFLVAAAALRRLDPSLEEAARGLGASVWRAFRTVVLPQVRPSAAAGALLVALYTLSDFGAVSLMRFDVFTRVVYAQYAGRLDRTPAAVLALVLVLLAVAVLVGEQRSRGRARYFTKRPSRPPVRFSLSRRGRIAATGFLLLLSAAALFAPLGVLAAWMVRGAARGQDLAPAWSAAAGSLAASTLAAAIAVAAALPVGVLVTRFRSRATAWVERMVYAVYALPHIAVALAVVFFASNYLGGLYQSLTLLVVIYAALFLAQALGSTRAGLLGVNPHLEEASRGLGRGPLRTLAAVTVPLMWRSMLAGGVLVFLTSMKELPAMLLLRPTGFDALSVDIWAAAGDLLYARAAAPALLLVAVSAIPMYVLALRANHA
jgi:iron(III) transport system permease protein